MKSELERAFDCGHAGQRGIELVLRKDCEGGRSYCTVRNKESWPV